MRTRPGQCLPTRQSPGWQPYGIAMLLLVAACGSDESDRIAPAESEVAAQPEVVETLRYDNEYPEMGYSREAVDNRVARLARSLEAREVTLEFEPGRGWLDGLLEALDIDASSQVLVFSRTSLQIDTILPQSPRAIYFNDDTYVAFVQDAPTLEIASFDSRLGPVFYTVEQIPHADVAFDRRLTACLRCHDSYSLTGGGVPRFIVGSGYIGTEGQLMTHEGWILTDDLTQLRYRWGGWYVTGMHGAQVHLGNIIVKNVRDLENLESLRLGNLENLDMLLDTSPYPTPYSDIVALLVLGHQTHIQNLITRVNYDVRTGGSAPDASAEGPAAEQGAGSIVEPLVEALLFVGEADITDRIKGSSGFAEHFASLGPRDAEGRSLREFNLTSRLFEHRLSYMIYSDAFAGLTDATKTFVYTRLIDILEGRDESEAFAHLAAGERSEILEILDATKPDFAAQHATASGPIE